MSGAAAIAAAKNRRGKTEPAPKSGSASSRLPAPVQTRQPTACSRTDAPPNKKNAPTPTPVANVNANAQAHNSVNKESLQITGPMHPIQILTLHEQRMNRFDERLNKALQDLQIGAADTVITSQQKLEDERNEEYFEECFSRLDTIEAKLNMLEDVIGNIQNKLTNVQNFMIETNLAVVKLNKLTEIAAAATTVSITSPPLIFTPEATTPVPGSPMHTPSDDIIELMITNID
jgi:hypothetical protein